MRFLGLFLLAGTLPLAAAPLASPGLSTGFRVTDSAGFVPWSRIGDIALGEPRARVEGEYGSVGHGLHLVQRYGENTQGYYRLHNTRVFVTFYSQRVGEFAFSTPYYRSSSGFGVGSRIPLGPCHQTALNRCEHRWRGFVWNGWNKGTACRCWVKAGMGPKSLPLTTGSFEKPWFFIYTHRGRVTSFYFALKFVD